MSINFDVVIESSDYSVDMKAGLDTLQGVSDATRIIAESFLDEKVAQRLSDKSNVRTRLKETFKGSYGHIYSLEVYDEEMRDKLNRIGEDTFAEIMSYYICESLYLESNKLSKKADEIIAEFGENSDKLIDQLRLSTLRKIHAVSSKFDKKVRVSLRKNSSERTTIGQFDKNTAESLQAKVINKEFYIEACITRFNIFTGNGRLVVKGSSETVAFGFGTRYKEVGLQAKKMFSENLNKNNGLDNKNWIYIKAQVKPMMLKSGKVVKYIITGLSRA